MTAKSKWALALLFVGSLGCERVEPEAQPSAPTKAAPAVPPGDKGVGEQASPPSPSEPASKETLAVAPASKETLASGGELAPSGAMISALAPLRPDAIASTVKYDGVADRIYGWSDANGHNIAVFSSKESKGYDKELEQDAVSRYLFVTHYAYPNGNLQQMRVVRDKEENCAWDITAGFDWKALSLTDLDGDGIGELTFAYETTCTSDVSPSTLKVLLLEGKEKYIIRGTTSSMPEFKSTQKLDPSVKNGPKAFREHLLKTFKTVEETGL